MALSDNLLLYWSLEETSGDAIDATGNGNDGTVTGATYDVTGKILKCFYFDGDDQIKRDTPLSAESGTISMWCYPTNLDSHRCAIGTEMTGYNAGEFYLFFESTDIRFCIDNGTSEKIIFSNDAPSINTWYHVVVLWGIGGMKMYINNVLQTDTDTETQPPSLSPWSVGQRFNWGGVGGDVGFVGKIDEVGIWERRLTEAEIEELWNNGNGLAYPFGEGTNMKINIGDEWKDCLLYTSPSPRDLSTSRMPSSA